MKKQWYQSKRLWAGIIGLLTAVSLIFTGEKSFDAMLPEIILGVISVIQTILGIATNDPIYVGSKEITIS